MVLNWNKISLYKFQQIDVINNRNDLDDLDKLLFTTCIVCDLTEYQLDNMKPVKSGKLIRKVSELFSKPFEPKPFNKIGFYSLNYDTGSMRFGQYMELSFFLSGDTIAAAHNILASMSGNNDSDNHSLRAEYFLTQPITMITGTISRFIENFRAFNKSYEWLFGLDVDVHEPGAVNDPFNKKYGWHYAAEQIAIYERIKLDDVYNLNIRNVFNDLAYLKAKSKYEIEQLKKK